MGRNAVKVLEISITSDSKKEILEYLRKYLNSSPKNTQKTLTIATPNTEQFVFAAHHPWFAKILNQADLTLPDSIGVVWARRMLGKKDDITPIPGVEFMEDLVQHVAQKPVRTALIGGRGGVAVKALECLHEKYAGVSGWAEEPVEFDVRDVSTYPRIHVSKRDADTRTLGHSDTADTFDTYIQKLAKKIIDTEVQMVFIALGPPKQELFMEALASSLRGAKGDAAISNKEAKPIILMVVGGSFDEISGRIPTAPRWVRVAGMKWLWRLTLEPWRIFRQLALVEFVFLVLKAKLRG